MTQFMSSTIFVPVSWSFTELQPLTLWELIQGLADVDRKVRRFIDSVVIWYNENILKPSRDQFDVWTAPFQTSSLLYGTARSPVTAAVDEHPRGHENHDVWKRTSDSSTTAAPAGGSGSVGGDDHDVSEMKNTGRRVSGNSGGYQRKVAGVPTILRVFYDHLFEEGFLFAYELARGKPHGRLSEHDTSHVPVMQLREDFLIILLLSTAFVLLYVLRQVRRRLALNLPAANLRANLPDLQDFEDLQVMEGLQDMQDIQNIPDLPDDIQDFPADDADMLDDVTTDIQGQMQQEFNN